MISVIGVRFKKAGKVYYFDPGDLQINKGDDVIVETARGAEYGKVVVGRKAVKEDEVVQPLKEVLRIATEEDRQHMEENQKKASEAFEIGLEKIEKHKLPMKLVSSEYTFDDSKLIFYFTADGRVDFRELVKDLASVFRVRIELRQIGVRDEAKMIGGMGPCGRPLCCASFLGDFEPVSIRMAKEQNLSLNPTKISGICGRLMCCLKYESEVYKEAKAELPYKGSQVLTEYGEAEVAEVDPLKQQITVKVDGQNYILDKDEIEEISKDKTKARKPKPKPQQKKQKPQRKQGVKPNNKQRKGPKPQPVNSGE